jgi:hypothetical protein
LAEALANAQSAGIDATIDGLRACKAQAAGAGTPAAAAA